MKFKRSDNIYIDNAGALTIKRRLESGDFSEIVKRCIGERPAQAKYGFDDVIISWITGMCTGKKRLEQIRHLQKDWELVQEMEMPSHDTINRTMKDLSTEVKKTVRTYHNKKKNETKIVETFYNDNIPLNDLLIQSSVACGALNQQDSYTLDIDATFIPTQRRAAVRKTNASGKIEHSSIGFYPMVCLIEDKPVFVSMRDGYAGSRYMLNECLNDTLALLDKSKVKVGRVISDAAGYNKQAVLMLDKRGIKFNIRFIYRESMSEFRERITRYDNWRKTEIRTANLIWDCEIAEFDYNISNNKRAKKNPTWKVIAVRMPVKKLINDEERENFVNAKLEKAQRNGKLKEQGRPHKDTSWKHIGNFKYKFYITNDMELNPKQVVLEFNQRGNAERKFTFMKNDFSWSHMPFYNSMAPNTVFMILSSLANNVFKGIIAKLKKFVPELYSSMRLDNFIAAFVRKPAQYIDGEIDFGQLGFAIEKIG